MSDLSQLGANLRNFVENVDNKFHGGIHRVTADMERQAKDTIQEFVRTTPSGLSPGKPDRIWTGAMHDNADARTRKTGDSYTIEYGWFGGFGNGDYVKDQELGSGDVAFGMHSFHAVRQRMIDLLHDFGEGKYFE